LFANADEIKSLMETDNLEEAILQLKGKCDVAAITDGEKGCTIVSSEAVISVPTAPVMNLVDTTGAGDLFAAGFLYGLAQGWSHRQSAELGNRCAGEIIQQLGARTQQPLNRLIA
jgi:adenosine kinase